jgi:hypothetical protein
VPEPTRNRRTYQRHGLYAVRDAVKGLEAGARQRWLNALGDTGQALREWRDGILADLRGPEAVSAQERAIVELASKTYLLVIAPRTWCRRSSSQCSGRRARHDFLLGHSRRRPSDTCLGSRRCWRSTWPSSPFRLTRHSPVPE